MQSGVILVSMALGWEQTRVTYMDAKINIFIYNITDFTKIHNFSGDLSWPVATILTWAMIYHLFIFSHDILGSQDEAF